MPKDSFNKGNSKWLNVERVIATDEAIKLIELIRNIKN